MLMSFRKNSTVVSVVPTPFANAFAMKLTVESVCNPRVGIGVTDTEIVGGVPTTLATFTLTGAEVDVCEFVSVTRAVRTRCPSWAAVGVQENVYGAVVSAPICTPSSRNSTRSTDAPPAADAVAAAVMIKGTLGVARAVAFGLGE